MQDIIQCYQWMIYPQKTIDTSIYFIKKIKKIQKLQ